MPLRCGASCLLAPSRRRGGASKQLAPHLLLRLFLKHRQVERVCRSKLPPEGGATNSIHKASQTHADRQPEGVQGFVIFALELRVGGSSEGCTGQQDDCQKKCPFPHELVSFLSGPGFETSSWRRNGRSGCSSCYPCTAPQGRHQLTHTVTARKRTRPISKAGCCQPQCGCGRVPFQILRSELQGLFFAEGHVQSGSLKLASRP